MVFEQEAAFETALINLLTEKYGWEPEILRYKTEEDLIQNWKQILFENNRDVDRLNDVPLTDGEMQQILDQITCLRTPLKLNGFINGKTVAVKRDNPADELHFGKEISLKIYDRQEIAPVKAAIRLPNSRYSRQGTLFCPTAGVTLCC